MTTKKAILAWVFSVIVSVAMLAIPNRALAHDHDGDGGHGHDHGWHRGWDNHHGWENHRGRGWGGDEDEEEEEEHEHEGNYQQPYGYGYQPYGYGYQAPYRYGYGQRYGNRLPSNGAGMVNPRHPGLAWACDSQGHHCHWARRSGYNNYRYPQSNLNPFAFNGAYNGNGYYGNNYGGNGYNGNAPMGGLGTMLGPLFGQPY